VVTEVHSRGRHYVRDFFGNRGGYIIFPNPGHRGVVVDLQGRAFPDSGNKPKYLNLPGPGATCSTRAFCRRQRSY